MLLKKDRVKLRTFQELQQVLQLFHLHNLDLFISLPINYFLPSDERLDRVESLLNQIIANNRNGNINTDALAVPTVQTNSSLGAESSLPQPPGDTYSCWTWGGKMGRPFPYDYIYPKKIPMKTMHDLWYEGIPSLKIRPFKFIKGTMLHNKIEAQAQCRAKSLVFEINKYLIIVDYLAQSAAVRDTTFKNAFNLMVTAFSTECDTLKKADHSISYNTLYEKFYVPVNRKRKLD
jgi:hypothetical protein